MRAESTSRLAELASTLQTTHKQEESKDKTYTDALILSFSRRLAVLQSEAEELRRHIDALQKVQAYLAMAATRTLAVSKQAPGQNRAAIVKVLKEADNGPLSVSEITDRVSREGLMTSSRGRRALSNNVYTVLRRNDKHVFLQVGNKWTLRGVSGLNVHSAGRAENRNGNAGPASDATSLEPH